MLPNTSVRGKITIPYLLLSVLTAIGIGVIAVRLVLDNVDKRFNNQLYETRVIATVYLEREEARMLETTRALANIRGMDTNILEENADGIRELIVGFVINNQEDVVEILDMDGGLLLAMRHKTGGQIEEYDYLQGGDFPYRDAPFISNVLNGQSDNKGNKFSGYIKTDWGQDILYIAGPIYDQDNSQIGVVLVGKTLSSITDEIRQKSLGQVSVYSTDGQLLSSTFLLNEPLAKDMVTDAFSFDDEESYSQNFPRREHQIKDLTYREILGPWQIRQGETIGVLGISLAENALITATLPTQLAIIAIIAISTLLIVFIGSRIATVITTPIVELVGASKEIAEGNLDVHIDPSTNDEIALLAQNFNYMTDSLDQSQKDLTSAYDATLNGWSLALELKDMETEGHTQRVTALTVEFARAFGIPEKEIVHIRRGAILHDIGKMGVPDSILQKPGKLSPEEWEIMRKHPENAYNMLKNIDYLKPALDIPYCHHERWDGKGYPRGLKGKEIPIAARLFSIVDAFDAISSNRPYRKGMSRVSTRKTITADKGSRYQPELVDFFMEFITQKTMGRKRSE